MCIPNAEGLTSQMQQTQQSMQISDPAPSAGPSPTYVSDLLSKATKEYPFISKHNPVVVLGQGEGYAETYPIGETGKPLGEGKFSRPDTLPRDKVGIEIYKPDNFDHNDLAGEILHADPVANATRNKLAASITPHQLKVLKEHSLDYQATLDEGRSTKDALQNATDSAMRGYVINQWPEEVNKAMRYTPNQLKLLDNLKTYMKSE